MGFSRQEYWSGLPFPSPGDVPNPGVESKSPTLQADTLPSEPPGKPPKGRGRAHSLSAAAGHPSSSALRLWCFWFLGLQALVLLVLRSSGFGASGS